MKNQIIFRVLFAFFFSGITMIPALAVCPVSGPIDVCENQTVSYSTPSNPGEIYSWNVTGGGTVTGSGNNISVAWTSPGTGSVTLIVKNNLNVVICTQTNSVTIHGKPAPVITPSFLSGCRGRKGGTGQSDRDECLVACDSTPITYSTPDHPGSTYTWTVTGSANSSASGNTVNVFWTGTGTGSVQVTETNAWGCSTTTEICVEIVGKPTAAFTTLPGLSGPVVNACLNQTIQFIDQSTAGTGSPLQAWSWYFGDGGNAFYNAPGNGNTSHAYSTPGTYTVMLVVENQCTCKDTAYVTVVVSSSPGPEIFCISTVCPDATVTYSTNAQGCTGYQWTATNGMIIGSNTDSTVTVQWGSTGPGILTLSVNCPGYCTAPTSVFVPIISPNATISGPSAVCLNECYTYHISCDIPIDSIEWTFPPGVTVTTDSVNVHEVQVCYYSQVSGNISVNYWHNTPGAIPPLNCGGSSVLAVAVKPQMFVSGPAEICENQFYSYSVIPPPTGTVYWTVTDISNSTTYTSSTINGNTPFSGTWTYGPGTFIVTANDVSGNYCNGPQKKYLTVNPIPPPPDTLYGPDPVCPNQSYVYTAVPTSSDYFIGWQVTNGSPSNGIGSSLSITWGPSGPYQVNVFQIDPITGCKSSPLGVSISPALPMPPTPIAGNDTVCANGSSAYSTSAPGDDYIWSINPSLAGSISSGQHTASVNVQWNNWTGNAWMVIERKICGSSRKDSMLIVVGGPPAPVITAPPVLCQGLTLSASGPSALTHSWNFGDGGTGSGNPGTHIYNAPGNYVITLTVNYGGNCPGTAVTTKSISILPRPDINISTPDPNLYCNPPISTTMSVAAPAIGTTYQWYNPTAISGANGTSYTATSTGSYFVVGTNAYGCSDTSNVIPISTGNCNPICTPAPYTLTYNRYRLGCNTDSFVAVTSSGVINLSWDFDDPYNPGAGSGSPVTHTFTEPGYYRVKLCASVPNFAGTGYCTVCMYLVDTIRYVPDFFDSAFCTSNSDSVQVKLVNTTKLLSGYPVPAWNWQVSPGAYSSTLKNPVFNLAPGNYTVTLTVDGVCTFTQNISIDSLTNASFNVQDSVCQGTPVLFSNTSTGTSLSSSWNFGDGASSLVNNPIRSYSLPGTYTATLTITNTYGCTDTAVRTVLVLPHTLSGFIIPGGPLKFCEGDSVMLTATAGGGYPAYSYLWSNAITLPSIWANQTGNYHVEFYDSKGCFYQTPNINVLAKTRPKPNIIGKDKLCENGQYSFVANYPNIPGAQFDWYFDGAPQFVNNNTLMISTWFMATGPHQVVVSVMSPDSCYGTDTLDVWLYPNPNVSISSSPVLCAGQNNMLAASSTSSNLTGYYWNNGQVNDTIYTGAAGQYTVTVNDSNGCSAQAFVFVNPLPDLCGLMTGCYDICDSVQQLVWYAPAGYAGYQWYFNGNPIPWADSDTIHIPLYQSGVYTVQITSAAGCSITSEKIFINFVECAACNLEAGVEAECGPVSKAGNQTYSLTFTVNNTLGAGSNITITSSQGSVSSVSPGTLAPGTNTITAVFEDLPAIDSFACFNVQISNNNVFCDTTVCDTLPTCGSKDCQLETEITEFECAGTDGSGNPQYYVCMNLNWSGSNGSTLTLSTASGSFVPNPVTVNNGTNSLCFTYTDLPPYNTFIQINLFVFDPATETVCKDSVRRDYRPCGKDTCSIGVYGLCAHCESEEEGVWNYDVDLNIMNPFGGPATVSILPISAGTFGPIAPNPVGPGLQTVSVPFTDALPANSIICFKVLLTDISSNRTCWQTVCLALPPCDSMTNIMVNLYDRFSLSVYPNPASDFVTLKYSFGDETMQNEFVLRDAGGRELMRMKAENLNGVLTIPAADYSAGLYFIEVLRDGRTAGHTKLIIVRN